MNINKDQIIFIKLLNEGTDVWRPTKGERIKDKIYRVLSTNNYNNDDEEWEFKPGCIVECEYQNRSSGRILVAVRKVDI